MDKIGKIALEFGFGWWQSEGNSQRTACWGRSQERYEATTEGRARVGGSDGVGERGERGRLARRVRTGRLLPVGSDVRAEARDGLPYGVPVPGRTVHRVPEPAVLP